MGACSTIYKKRTKAIKFLKDLLENHPDRIDNEKLGDILDIFYRESCHNVLVIDDWLDEQDD